MEILVSELFSANTAYSKLWDESRTSNTGRPYLDLLQFFETQICNVKCRYIHHVQKKNMRLSHGNISIFSLFLIEAQNLSHIWFITETKGMVQYSVFIASHDCNKLTRGIRITRSSPSSIIRKQPSQTFPSITFPKTLRELTILMDRLPNF